MFYFERMELQSMFHFLSIVLSLDSYRQELLTTIRLSPLSFAFINFCIGIQNARTVLKQTLMKVTVTVKSNKTCNPFL